MALCDRIWEVGLGATGDTRSRLLASLLQDAMGSHGIRSCCDHANAELATGADGWLVAGDRSAARHIDTLQV